MTQFPERKDVFAPHGRCVRCGFDLQGLAENENCPECSLAIADSRRSDQLVNAKGTRFIAMRAGLVCYLVATLYYAIAHISITSVVIEQYLDLRIIRMLSDHAYELWVAVYPLELWVFIMLGIATFLVTVHARIIGSELWAFVARSSIVLALGADVFSRTLHGDGYSSSLSSTSRYVYLLSTLSLIGLLIYLRAFARRIPDRKLWIGSAVAACLFGLGVFEDAYLSLPHDWRLAIPGGSRLADAFYVLAMGSVVWLVVLLIRFLNRVSALRREQRRFGV